MALTDASTLSVNKAAYEQIAYRALRPELIFERYCTFKATNQAPDKGVSVTFTFNNDIADATTALTDGVDITPVAMSDSQVTLTPAEYGNAVKLTAKNEATAFYELNPVAADTVGWNAGSTRDSLAAAAAVAGTKVVYSAGTSRATVTKAGILSPNNIRAGRSWFTKKSVRKFGNAWVALIHADPVYDITGATGGSGWLDPHVYGNDQSPIWDGVMGNFQGFNFVESGRSNLMFSDAGNGVSCTAQAVSGNTATLTITAHGMNVGDTFTLAGGTATSGTGSTSQVGFNRQFTVLTAADANTVTVDITGITATCTAGTATLTSKNVDVYATILLGREGLGRAYSTGRGYGLAPVIVDVPVTDALRRVTGVGWKDFIAFGVIRQDAVYRIESGSALGI